MTERPIYTNKNQLPQISSPKSSLYRLKKTFAITPNSPLSTERVLKFKKIEIVPIDLQNMLEQLKSKESPTSSPKNQAIWPPKLRKEEFKIETYDLYQSVRKTIPKVDDIVLDKLEFIHAQNPSEKTKSGKMFVSLLTTPRGGVNPLYNLADPTTQEKEKENNLKKSLQKKLDIIVNERSMSDAVDCYVKEDGSTLPIINTMKNINSPKNLVNNIFKNKPSLIHSKSFKGKFETTTRVDVKQSDTARLVPNQNKRAVLLNTETIIRSTRVLLAK